MSNSWFAFKQFTVFHDRCSMKVGTDAVLLGAWVNIENTAKILDAGTGTGLIALMCAQRSNAFVDAVEIDSEACIQASENFLASPWHNRLKIVHDTFQHYSAQSKESYDLVVANPPYFRNSLRPEVNSRSVARHDDKLSYEALMHGCSQIMKAAGRIAVIIPYQDREILNRIAHAFGFLPIRECTIKPTSHKPPIRYMAEFSGNSSRYFTAEELTIRAQTNGLFTNEYMRLTEDFYLAF